MNRSILGMLLLGVGACSSTDVVESVAESNQALNGVLSSEGFLTIKGGTGLGAESARRFNTNAYYASTNTNIGSSGQGNSSISQGLATLDLFRAQYGFGTGLTTERTAYYYNRGDLGLGREMHCVDRNDIDGQIACYVTNYSSGDDFGEFTFGLSKDIAFANMNAVPPRVLATVAMVYRRLARTDLGRDQMLFMAYNAAGDLADNAPLDRHGINFAKEFNENGEAGPEFGEPGVNFNNHIPSNCLNCHGGTYDPTKLGSSTTPSVAGAVFLPWDLDQFEFETVAGRTRAGQEDTLRDLNLFAFKVAAGVRGGLSPIAQQIVGWYNGSFTGGSFTSGYVPPGWRTTDSNGQAVPGGDPDFYYKVARRCRGCHLASTSFPFDSASQFLTLADLIAGDVASHKMPHALQAQREFWLSSQSQDLAAYFRANGKLNAAQTLSGGGPNLVVTLDPYAIAGALF